MEASGRGSILDVCMLLALGGSPFEFIWEFVRQEGFRVSGDSLWGVTTSHGEHIMIIGCGARPGLPEDDMGQRALVSAVPPTVRWR